MMRNLLFLAEENIESFTTSNKVKKSIYGEFIMKYQQSVFRDPENFLE